MKNVVASGAEMRVLTQAADSSARALSSARYVFQELQRHFRDKAHADSGLVFTPQGCNRVIAKIDSPCGVGRAVFSYALGEHYVNGRIVIERQQYLNDEAFAWEPVFTICVPTSDAENPFFFTDDGGKRSIYTKMASDDDAHSLSLSVAGYSIFRAIIQGPQ